MALESQNKIISTCETVGVPKDFVGADIRVPPGIAMFLTLLTDKKLKSRPHTHTQRNEITFLLAVQSKVKETNKTK